MRAEIAATPELLTPCRRRAAGSPRRRAPAREVETALIGRILWRRRKCDRRRAGARRPRRARLLPAGHAAIHRDRANPRRSPRQAGGQQRRQSVLDRRRRRRHPGREPGQRAAIERRAAARHRGDASRARSRVQRRRPVLGASRGFASLLRKAPDADAMARPAEGADAADAAQAHGRQARRQGAGARPLGARPHRPSAPPKSPTPSPTPISPIRPTRAPTPAATPRRSLAEPARRIAGQRAGGRERGRRLSRQPQLRRLLRTTGQRPGDQPDDRATLGRAEPRRLAESRSSTSCASRPGAQGTPEAMASATMVRLRDRESAIVEKLASAGKQLGPLHPEIASLQQSLRRRARPDRQGDAAPAAGGRGRLRARRPTTKRLCSASSMQ